MKSLRWRFAVWFTLSLLAVLAVFVGITYTHLQYELRVEKWERSQPGRVDWKLHGSYSESEVDDIAGELRTLALLYAGPVALLALGLGYYLARRSFEPVAVLNRQLQAIGSHSLQQRVRLPDADQEFQSIEKNLNNLLARLEDSFRQLAEYSAQVAHELRTPLTLLRLQVEEAAGRIEPELAESLQDELRRLSDYVDQCLQLATVEQGRFGLELQPVPLRGLVAEMIEVYELLARSENRILRVTAPEELTVQADARSLRQMLHNLLTNALRHGDGPILVSLERNGRDVRCRIENALLDRPSPATGAATGTGLGLRLVRALAAAHPDLQFTHLAAAGRFVAELRWPMTD
jgi:signal transduction histidine kinase